jgi:hypothetical protein
MNVCFDCLTKDALQQAIEDLTFYDPLFNVPSILEQKYI